MQPTVMAPVCASGGIICYGRSYRTTFFPDFPPFFLEEKQEYQEEQKIQCSQTMEI